MRASVVALVCVAALASAGCVSSHKKPYAQNPLLLYYKPTLSDSATIMAERNARRDPVRPPAPLLARELERDRPGLPRTSSDQIVIPASAETTPLVPDAPTEIKPIIRQSSGPVVPVSTRAPWRTECLTIPVTSIELPEIGPAHVSLPLPDSKPAEPVPASAPPVRNTVEPIRRAAEPVQPLAEPVCVTAKPPEAVRRTVPGSYGHESDYSWLQGVLERHYRGHFYLRYCDPSQDDANGGKVQVDDERLAQFREGDIIAVTGSLQPAAAPPGPWQNPRYQIRDLWRAGRE